MVCLGSSNLIIMPEYPVNNLEESTVAVNPSAADAPENFDPPVKPQSLPPDRVARLYKAVGFLAGISILLLGIMSGFTIWLLIKQNQLEQQLEALSALTPEIERVRGIETQVKALNQQVKKMNQRIPQGLSNQLKSTETQLTELTNRLDTVESDVAANGQTNNALREALKNSSSNQNSNSQRP